MVKKIVTTMAILVLLSAATSAQVQWRIAPDDGYVWQPAPSEFQRPREFTEPPVLPNPSPGLVWGPDTPRVVPNTPFQGLVPRRDVPHGDADVPGDEDEVDQSQ